MASQREVTLVLNVATKGAGAVASLFNAAAGPALAAGPLKLVGEGLGRLKDQMELLNVAMHPDILAAQAKAELDLAEKRQQYKAALEAQKEAIAPLVLKVTELESAFKGTYDKIQLLQQEMKPGVIQERAEAELRLLEVEQEHKKALDAAKETLIPTVLKVTELESAFKGTYDEIQKLQQTMDPASIREQAAAELKLKGLRKEHAKLLAAETTAQGGGDGFFKRMFKQFSGGKEGAAGLAPLIQSVSGGGIMGGLKGVLGAAGPYGAAAAVALSAVTDTLKGLHQEAIAFAGKASPATVERLTLAWDDFEAVIGRTTIPYVELLTDSVRLMGDVLQSILPSTQDVREALTPFRDVLGELRSALGDIAPALKLTVIVQLRMFAGALAALIWPLTQAIKLFGLVAQVLGFSGTLSSSVGAAARPASYMGIAEYGEKAQLAMAGAGGSSPEEQTANYLRMLYDRSTKYFDWAMQVSSAVSAAGSAAEETSGIGTLRRGLRYMRENLNPFD